MKILVVVPVLVALASAAPATQLDATCAVNEFGWTFLKSLDTSDNQFFSAPSIATAFTMVAAGASGDTAKQLSAVFRHGMLNGHVHEQFGKLNSQLKTRSSNDLELAFANKIYVQSGLKLKDAFNRTLTSSYQAAIEQANFARFAEKITADINAWVNQETRGMIPRVLSRPLPPDTAMALLNAIYFKGRSVFRGQSANHLLIRQVGE